MLAGYDELYSTSQDVFEKKIKVLDEEIKDKAIDLANETIMKVKSRPQKIAKMVEEGGKEENEKEKRTTRTRKTNKQ